MGSLDENTSSIARVGFAATGSAMLHIGQHGERILYQFVGLDAIQIGHQPRTTGVFFQLRNVQTLVGLLHMQNCCLISKKYSLCAART